MTNYPPYTPNRATDFDWSSIPEDSPYRQLEGTDTAIYIREVAGTQYYQRGRYDHELEQRIWPRAGDVLDLVRQPENPHDFNAIQIRYKNAQYMIGHVPRGFAEYLAPAMDAGQILRAYCTITGDHRPWTMCFAITGPVIEGWMTTKEQFDIEATEQDARDEAEYALEHARWAREMEEYFVRQAIATGEGIPAWAGQRPDWRKEQAIDDWDRRLRDWRDARRLDAARAFRGVGAYKIVADDLPVPERGRFQVCTSQWRSRKTFDQDLDDQIAF
jgi:hypothetical protein